MKNKEDEMREKKMLPDFVTSRRTTQTLSVQFHSSYNKIARCTMKVQHQEWTLLHQQNEQELWDYIQTTKMARYRMHPCGGAFWHHEERKHIYRGHYVQHAPHRRIQHTLHLALQVLHDMTGDTYWPQDVDQWRVPRKELKNIIMTTRERIIAVGPGKQISDRSGLSQFACITKGWNFSLAFLKEFLTMLFEQESQRTTNSQAERPTEEDKSVASFHDFQGKK